MTVYVFGHRNPDTDAICSAIAYAKLLAQTTMPDAVAACCGPPNARTEYVLKRAGVNPPRIVMDVRPEIQDVCRKPIVTAREDEVFFEVYDRLNEYNLREIPVLSDEGNLVGMVWLTDILELVFRPESNGDPLASRRVVSSLEKICTALDGKCQHQVEPERTEDVLMMVGAMSAGGFTGRLNKMPAEQLLVVSGDRPTIQLPAIEKPVRGLVVTGGYELSPGLLQLAVSNGVTVIISPHDTATTVLKIKSASTISSAIRTQFLTVSEKQLVRDVQPHVARARNQTIFPVVDDHGKIVGMFSKADLLNPPKPRLILVDHNELDQAVLGAEEAEILEVLDHHRLGGSLKSSQPIRFINEPVGSTCTLVAKRYQEAGVKPDKGVALCMAAGIISDTLFLRSPTATKVDHQMLEWLGEHAECDLDEFAQGFFDIGSALQTRTPTDVLLEDCKEFDERGQRFSISQIEEMGFELFWKRQEEISEALEQHTVNRELDFAALLVTDISTNSSLLLMSREPMGWEDFSYPSVGNRLYELAGVVSRKKQLLPLISRLLNLGAAK